MNSRGLVLVNTVILLLIMVFVSGAMLQMALGRTAQVARFRSGTEGKRQAESMNRIIEACLTDMWDGHSMLAAPCPGGNTGVWKVPAWSVNTPRTGCYTNTGAAVWDQAGRRYDFTAVWCTDTENLELTCTDC